MPIDLTLIPATLDIGHIALGALAGVLLMSLLLSVFSQIRLKGRIKAMPVTAPTPAVEPVKPVIVREASPDAALQLLGLLQHEARFLDFIQEDIAAHADADIGAAVRVVHEGCRKVLRQHVVLEPIRNEAENTRITLPKGYDAAAVRVSGHLVGEPPFTGTLIHRGWRAGSIQLPKLADGHDARILAPAEVEL